MRKVGVTSEILDFHGTISIIRSCSLLGMSYHLFCVSNQRDGLTFCLVKKIKVQKI